MVGYDERAVLIGRHLFRCRVARSFAQQNQGLQGFPPLRPDEGMIFVFPRPKAATFHMGSVSFPIDLVFADAGRRIARVVHNARPGSADRWSQRVCSAVVEVAGGTCSDLGIRRGDPLRVLGHPLSAQLGTSRSYNLPRALIEADAPPLQDGFYYKEPYTRPDGGDDQAPEEKFLDRHLPDEAFSEASDQPFDGWDQQMGYAPGGEIEDGPLYMTRRSQLADPALFGTSMVEAVARAGGIAWAPDTLNAGSTESAVVTPADIEKYVRAMGVGDTQSVMAAATTQDGLQAFGDALVLAQMADQARVKGGNLVLSRGRQ